MAKAAVAKAGAGVPGAPPREVELKLELDPADLTALLAHPLLAKRGRSAATTQTLRSVYYDTDDRRLQAAGCSLRVRADGVGFVQTVKAEASAGAGLFDRAEWETPVPGPRPSGRALKGTPAAEILVSGGAKALRPLFTTVMERTRRSVARGGTRATLTVDSGRVEDGDGRLLPLCEVELELERGTPTGLFGIARALGAAVPLRPGTRSKSERGRALVEGRAHAVAKAEPVALPEAATVAQGFQAIARACLRHLAVNEAAFLAEPRPEALHQVRVALRRLRAALSLFRDLVADEAVDDLKAELKRLIEPLGRARNLDVFLGETLPAEIARRPDEKGLTDLVRRIEAERDLAYAAVTALIGGPEWRRFILDLVAWIEAGPWLADASEAAAERRDRPLAAFGAEALAGLRRKVARKGRHLADLDPHARHRVRIQAKRLRYAAEFLAGAFPRKKARRRHAEFVAALSTFQDELGALNDIATGHALAAELVASLPPERKGRRPVPTDTLFSAGVVAADTDGRADAHLAAAEAAHAAFRKVKRFWR